MYSTPSLMETEREPHCQCKPASRMPSSRLRHTRLLLKAGELSRSLGQVEDKRLVEGGGLEVERLGDDLRESDGGVDATPVSHGSKMSSQSKGWANVRSCSE